MTQNAQDDRYTQAFRELATATQPDELALRRVRHRVLDNEVPVTALLKQLPEPSAVRVAAVRARIGHRRPRGLPMWQPGLALLAAAALAFVGFELLPGPARIDADLTADVATARALGDLVQVTYAGSGDVHGQDRQWRIGWESGKIDVEVEPQRGVDLTVDTRDASVHVVGTGFTVTRDALGTHVDVRHGKVAVRCTFDGREALVGAGGQDTCLPSTPVGLLGRANALADAGAAPAEVLGAVDLGLSRQPTAAVEGELLAARIGPLVALGRGPDALETAERYLAGSSAPRAEEVHRVAASLALQAGDCAQASAHLAALATPTETEAEALRRCAAVNP